ncbi:MAG: Anaphase-promoting complex, cyclosome, subunit 3 [Firmicutes bacterium]|nr:Anaphase-promoting complex, cyclosome, subunit 3 [Bacillota bacterium]
MAEVELKQYPGAISHLRDAIEVQPQRPEPYLALSRAYQETGRYALAADAAAVALKLAPGDADALKRQAAVDSMVSHTAPTDLTAAATVRLEDGPYAIYLYPGAGEKSTAVVYLKGPEGVVGLPAGRLKSVSRKRIRLFSQWKI